MKTILILRSMAESLMAAAEVGRTDRLVLVMGAMLGGITLALSDPEIAKSLRDAALKDDSTRLQNDTDQLAAMVKDLMNGVSDEELDGTGV